MGVRLERRKRRNLLASAVYKINRYLPLIEGRYGIIGSLDRPASPS
jgi:hypothetical protein